MNYENYKKVLEDNDLKEALVSEILKKGKGQNISSVVKGVGKCLLMADEKFFIDGDMAEVGKKGGMSSDAARKSLTILEKAGCAERIKYGKTPSPAKIIATQLHPGPLAEFIRELDGGEDIIGPFNPEEDIVIQQEAANTEPVGGREGMLQLNMDALPSSDDETEEAAVEEAPSERDTNADEEEFSTGSEEDDMAAMMAAMNAEAEEKAAAQSESVEAEGQVESSLNDSDETTSSSIDTDTPTSGDEDSLRAMLEANEDRRNAAGQDSDNEDEINNSEIETDSNEEFNELSDQPPSEMVEEQSNDAVEIMDSAENSTETKVSKAPSPTENKPITNNGASNSGLKSLLRMMKEMDRERGEKTQAMYHVLSEQNKLTQHKFDQLNSRLDLMCHKIENQSTLSEINNKIGLLSQSSVKMISGIAIGLTVGACATYIAIIKGFIF